LPSWPSQVLSARRGALVGRPEAVELDVLEVLNREQTDALDRYLETSREG